MQSLLENFQLTLSLLSNTIGLNTKAQRIGEDFMLTKKLTVTLHVEGMLTARHSLNCLTKGQFALELR
jgi:hypothetical protein